MKKKLLSWILALSLMLSLCTVGVFADDVTDTPGNETTETLVFETPAAETPAEETPVEEATHEIARGQCGDESSDLTWVLTSDGVLTISGNGAMANFGSVDGSWQGNTPWYQAGYQERITAVVIESGVTGIGARAFANCSGMTAVPVLPDTLRSIGDIAFFGCSALSGELHLPDGLERIGSHAFRGCSISGTLTIPASVKKIEVKGFYATSIENLDLNEGLSDVGAEVFMNCSALTGTVRIPETMSYIPERMFANDGALRGIGLHEGIEYIDPTAFYKCSALSGALRLPDRITSIGGIAFFGTGYCALILPAQLTTVGKQSFDGLSSGSVIYFQPPELRETLELWANNGNTEVYSHRDTALACTNGGSFAEDTAFASGALAVPVREGYGFVGWYESADFSGEAVTVPAAGVTYYARWAKMSDAEIALRNAINTAPDGVETVIPISGTIELAENITISAQKKLILQGTTADAMITFSVEAANVPLEKNCTMFYIVPQCGASITVKDLVLDGARKARLFYLGDGSALTLEDGGVLQNGYPAGSTTTSSGSAGAVWVREGSRFIMNGGKITGNEARRYGGGIYSWCNAVEIQINGGEISENKGAYAGGIVALGTSAGALRLNGGKILNNTNLGSTSYGAGIFAQSISIYLGGDIEIRDNVRANGTVSDFYFNAVTPVMIDRPLTGDVRFANCRFTNDAISAAEGYTLTESDAAHLTPSDAAKTFYLEHADMSIQMAAPDALTSVRFLSAFGSGSMADQRILKNTDAVLASCGYRETGYIVESWNTAVDGSGAAYPAGGTINTSEPVTLYAQWIKCPGHIYGDDAVCALCGYTCIFAEELSAEGTNFAQEDAKQVSGELIAAIAQMSNAAAPVGLALEEDTEAPEAAEAAPATATFDNETAAKVYEAAAQNHVLDVKLELAVVNADAVSAEDLALIQSKESSTATDVEFLDISIQIVDETDHTTLGNMTELTQPVTVSITVPAQFRTEGRVFYIIRIHNGVAERINGDYDAATGIFTFQTDKFSTYALSYDHQWVTVGDENGHHLECAACRLCAASEDHDGAVCSVCGYANPHLSAARMLALLQAPADSRDPAAARPAVTFTDVPAGAYYADAVAWAVNHDIASGMSAAVFDSNSACTRGQMVAFLWRAAGCPEPTDTGCAFTDVDQTQYYYKAVLWAVEKGITKGTDDTTFSPDATVNRGQAVTFLYRYAGEPTAVGTSAFSDVPAGAYYADAVQWAVDAGVAYGTGAADFSPAAACIRAQVVTFLYRLLAK